MSFGRIDQNIAKTNKVLTNYDVSEKNSYDATVEEQEKKIFRKKTTIVALGLTSPLFFIFWPIIAGIVHGFAKTEVDSALAYQRLWFIHRLSKQLQINITPGFAPKKTLDHFIITCKNDDNSIKYEKIFKDTDKNYVIQLAESYNSDRMYAKDPLVEIYKGCHIYDCDTEIQRFRRPDFGDENNRPYDHNIYYDYDEEIKRLYRSHPEYAQYPVAKAYKPNFGSEAKIKASHDYLAYNKPENYSCPADDISHWKTLLKVQQKKEKALQAIKKLRQSEGQGASENQKCEVRPTQPKTDSSGYFGINPNYVGKLSKQYERAQFQASQEPSKAFCYKPAPSGYYTENIKNRSSGSKEVAGYQVGFCHDIGQRSKMEDEHLATSFDLNIEGKTYRVSLFGVFDGHGGKGASIWLREHLEKELHSTLNEMGSNGLTDADIWNALKATFIKLDKSFNDQQDKRYYTTPGSTATMAMILDGKLWTANVGDSRTILDNGIQLSEDAKPGDPYYQKGIVKRGGTVTMCGRIYRINDCLGTPNLAVARAVGDRHILGVCPNPKITVYSLADIPQGSHLILACDGIYDVASTSEVADAVREHKIQTAQGIAENIVYSAYESGSKDNLSALVVKL